MKIQNYKIDQYCKDLIPETPAILLYGQDYGLISERSSIIVNSFFKNTKNQHSSLNIIDIMYNDLLSNPEMLEIEASSISLLSSKKVIRIKDTNDSLHKVAEDYLLNSYKDCLIVFLSDTLSPKSKIRKLFESHKEAVILPCYNDENNNITGLISNTFKEEGVYADESSISFFANYLGLDRLITKAEIEKAILYAGKSKKLDSKDFASFISDQTSLSIDELYDFSLAGNLKEAYRALVKIQKEGTPAIQIIRSFIRQMQSLYNILNASSLNSNINSVIDSIRPPIYFKRKNNIKSQAQKWSLQKVYKALLLLESAEISCKKPKSNVDVITKQVILSIGLINKN